MKKITRNKVISLIMAVLICSSAFLCAGVASGAILEREYQTCAVPPSQNQKNMVARADYYYGITWVAQQTVEGWSGTFYQGGTYHIPYGQPIYSGKYVGYGATFEEFLTAANTAGSIFYTRRSWYDGPTAPYYVSDCSAFVSWVWGIDRKTTYYIPSVSTSFGNVTLNRATNTLQLGDALNCSAHVVMVTGLEYDASGAITKIEITEQTPPQMKRSYYTPYQLYNKYSSYTIQRYYGDVPVAPGQQEETWIEKACFDVMVYRDRNKDLAGMTDAELKEHWRNYGIKEGRASSTILDLGFYRNNNSDLIEAFGTDYEKIYNHFITSGYKEYRKSSALFDGSYYTNKYSDVASSCGDEYLRHYVDNGQAEGRRASLTFDPDYYWYILPDVYEAWPDDYTMCARHYAGHGINAQIVAYDNQHPVVSDVEVTNVTAEGYTVTCTVTDNWGINKVAFPTWTVNNGQDDLPEQFMNTQLGTKDGNTFTFYVKASDHNNETGEYATHIYAVDKGGNTTHFATEVVDVKDPVITLTSTSDYTTDDVYVYGIEAGTSVTNLLAQFENEGLEVVDCNGNVISGSAVVGTGAQINLYQNSELVDSATVVVLGDADGNGIVDVTDYQRVKALILGKLTLTGAQSKAADIDGNGIVDRTDSQKVKDYFLGTYDLSQ